MQFKSSFWKPAVVGLVAITTGGWLLQQGSQGNVYTNQRVLQEVIRTVSDRYVEEIDPAELYDLAVDGLLEQLGDPHSTLLRPEDYSDLRLSTEAHYGGLGIRIDEKDDWITVVQTLPNTPADRAGLRPGDRLIEVDGESMEGWSADRAVRTLRGPKGAPVQLKIARPGVPEPIPVRIVRDEIEVDYVTGFILQPGVGYISQQQFSKKAADEIRALVDSLTDQGMKGLIFDLRGNPGGLLEEGVAVSDLFLPRGTDVVETRSRMTDQNETYRASEEPIDPDLPVIVLVDGYSASASEIVAGALQDHDRALVVGTPTFGKGSVQTLYPVSGGNFLKLTTAKWYTPVGRSIHRLDMEQHLVALRQRSVGRGVMTQEPDTAEREVYYTDGGREVYGGGGITPDLIVEGDTLTLVEREFRSSLGDQLAPYSDAVFRYAVQYSGDHPDLSRNFEVTGAVLDELYRWLQNEGIEVDRELYDGSSRIVGRELGIHIGMVGFGQTESIRRRLVLDRQIDTAVELLREGDSQSQLFALAEVRQGAGELIHQE